MSGRDSEARRTNKNMGLSGSKTASSEQQPEMAEMVGKEITSPWSEQLDKVSDMFTAMDKLPHLVEDAKKAMNSFTEKNQIIENLQKKVNELEQKMKLDVQSHVKETQQLNTSVEYHARVEKEYRVKYESASTDLSIEKANNRTLTDNLAIANKNVRALLYEKQKLSERISELQAENGNVAKELSDCKSRLSKLLSDRLTDNNPQIADLSDPNRPTKLAEKHSELYDNQWTDAFEVLQESFDEEKSIQKLLSCLMHVQEFCTEKAAAQVSRLKQVAYMRTAEGEQRADTVELKALIREIRKQTAESSAHQVFKAFVSKYPIYSSNPIICKFVEECVKLCWLMNAQDPPVVFAKTPAETAQFNTDLYKPYTQSGETMKFIVWPALLLHGEGSVLARGVAQGLKAEENQESGGSARADRKPYSDPKITSTQDDTDTKPRGFAGSDNIGFQDAHVKKDAIVTNTNSQAVQKSNSHDSQSTNAILYMDKPNMGAPQSQGSGSDVAHTRQAESTYHTQADTHNKSTAATAQSNLGASVRTSQNTATTQDQQNWSKSVGGISTSHGYAIPTAKEMSDFYKFWGEKGERYCRDMMGHEVFAKCNAYYNSFPKQQ